MVARVLERVGIKPCGGCKKRQEALNRWVPYRQDNPQLAQRTPMSQKANGEAARSVPTAERSARTAVVLEARSWIGTPYVLGGRVKGAGCDCATLLLEVYRRMGFISSETLRPISADWFEHTTEDQYVFRVLRHAERVATAVADRSSQIEPGNIVLTRVAGSKLFNHGGIVVDWPWLVHASQNGVEEIDASRHPMWMGRLIVVFDPFLKRELRHVR
jgi:cell wall-associated NlpC family hydrolase